MSAAPAMPFRFWQLLLLFLFIYLGLFQVRDVVEAESLGALFTAATTPHGLTLLFFSGVAFFTYCLVGYAILYRWYDRLPRWQLWLVLFGAILVCMPLRAFWEEVVVHALTGSGNYNPRMPWSTYLADQVLYVLVFTTAGIGFYLLQRSRFQELARQRSETLRIETELKFLRSQVNPHFLFNTLNNLYSLVHQGSPQALPALDKLSGLLRYSLYEQGQLVPIEREIAHLRDLVHLEQMRVEGLAPVEWRVGEFRQAWCLPPLLLVPFVENAFKHGDLRQAPLLIELAEDAAGNLQGTIRNRRSGRRRSVDGTGGIGIENVRKRLELLYPGTHTLTIGPDRDYFTVRITLLRAAARRCRELPARPEEVPGRDALPHFVGSA